jgi:Flp pilus assembly pilin Flp
MMLGCRSLAGHPGNRLRDAGVNGGLDMTHLLRRLWSNDEAQDIAEYAVLLAVILVLVVGTVRLIGANANNVFSTTASSISQ